MVEKPLSVIVYYRPEPYKTNRTSCADNKTLCLFSAPSG